MLEMKRNSIKQCTQCDQDIYKTEPCLHDTSGYKHLLCGREVKQRRSSDAGFKNWLKGLFKII